MRVQGCACAHSTAECRVPCRASAGLVPVPCLAGQRKVLLHRGHHPRVQRVQALEGRGSLLQLSALLCCDAMYNVCAILVRHRAARCDVLDQVAACCNTLVLRRMQLARAMPLSPADCPPTFAPPPARPPMRIACAACAAAVPHRPKRSDGPYSLTPAQSAVAMPSASTPLRRTDYGACLQEKEVRRPLRRLGDTAPPLRQRRGGLGRVYRSVELLAEAAQHRRRIARHGAGRVEEPAHRAAAAQPGASARHCAAPLCCDVSSGRPTRRGCGRPLRECVPHRPAARGVAENSLRVLLSTASVLSPPSGLMYS